MLTRVMPVAVVGDQVIGRHLVPAPGAGGDLAPRRRPGRRARRRRRDRQRGVAAVRAPQLLDRQADELVDVADIVGEQHEVLEMLGRRAGVVAQPGEAEIGARPVEQRERPRAVADAVPGAVGDLVADVDQLGRREPARQLGGADLAELDLGAVEHIGIGDFARRTADRDARPHSRATRCSSCSADSRGTAPAGRCWSRSCRAGSAGRRRATAAAAAPSGHSRCAARDKRSSPRRAPRLGPGAAADIIARAPRAGSPTESS